MRVETLPKYWNLEVAIAILNYNGKHWLEKFLPTVVTHSGMAKVYVIDNASTDNSVSFVREKFPMVKIIENLNNSGFAGGYNDGLKELTEDIYCLLNSDVEVTENWLTPIINLFQKNQDIAAIQPKVLSYHQKSIFEFAGAGGGRIDHLGYPYCRGRIFDSLEEDRGQYDDECEIFWASGCCLFIRREDFWAMNGFDARFFAHQEEIDLCWRLINSGRKIFYSGKSTIYHVGGGTLGKENPNKTYLNIRNNLCMMLKNLPLNQLVWKIPLRLVLDGIAAVYFGYKKGFGHFWAVIRAHFAFYSRIPSSWKLRGATQKSDFYQSKWLIFKHFFR